MVSQATRHRRRQAGLCPRCGLRPPAPGKARCLECGKVQNESSKRFQTQRLAAGLCAECGLRPLRADKARYCQECTDKHSEAGLARYHQDREAAIEAYGGYVCRCCGETWKPFLTIDHIDGGGNQHRKKVGAANVYRWLRLNGYPPGFQVLCMNCQFGKRICGVCPHVYERLWPVFRLAMSLTQRAWVRTILRLLFPTAHQVQGILA
jgi:hypothetical protein